MHDSGYHHRHTLVSPATCPEQERDRFRRVEQLDPKTFRLPADGLVFGCPFSAGFTEDRFAAIHCKSPQFSVTVGCVRIRHAAATAGTLALLS